MDYLFQDGGKPKKAKTTKSKTTKSKTTKKGGNFLGAVGDLVAPTGWGPFATAAGLLALDRADALLRRGKSTKSSAKKGGMRGGDPGIKLRNNHLLNKLGANKSRGTNPNRRQELLNQKKQERLIQNQEQQFGNLGELQSFPKTHKKSNILTNSRGVNTMKNNQELQFGKLSELQSFPKPNKKLNILTNSRGVNSMKKNALYTKLDGV